MAALAVAIVGAPLTMSFLALETTGDFPLALAILMAVTLVSVVVRRSFGYSFATWRLHLRGESIRSAQDIGWMRALTVARLMRADLPRTPADASLADFKAEFPLGAASWVAAVDAGGRDAGLISVAEAHLAATETAAGPASLAPLLRAAKAVLRPEMNIKEAADLFERDGERSPGRRRRSRQFAADRPFDRGTCAASLYRGAGAGAQRSFRRTLVGEGLSVAEDQAPFHDYLSIGVKFEYGQDLTYFWCIEL